jgi:ketosteroid isomerase-like protein
MFRAFVAHRVRVAWSHLARRDYGFVLDQLAPTFTHSFAGDHALGGERHSRATQRAWFERLFRLLPDADFTLDDVLVRGWPWRTRAVVLLRVRATVAGRPYENEFVQTLDLRWGRISRIHNLEDTQKLAVALKRLADTGIDEARSAAISDHEPVAIAA